jgi:hypothetical protein
MCWLTLVILATQEVEIGKTVVQGQPKKKGHKRWWCVTIIPAMWRSTNRRLVP